MSRSDLYSLLPSDLQPPTDLRSMGFKNGVRAAVEFVDTMNSLPIGLKPRKGIRYTPPKFVYGWMMVSNEEFCDFIEKNYPYLVGNATWDDEEYVDVGITLKLVREYFVNELEVGAPWRPSLEPAVELEDKKYEALAITNSYEHGNKIPPPEVIEKFKAFFHWEEEPRWFLHSIHYRWRKRRILRRNNGELDVRIE